MPHVSTSEPVRDGAAMPRPDGEARASALAVSGEDFGRMVDLSAVRFDQRDRHEVLLGAASDPLPIGARVTLGFRMAGRLAAHGTVEACEPAERRWRMAVRLDGQIAC